MADITSGLKLQIIENERKQIDIDEEIRYARNKIKAFEILIDNLMLDKEELRLEWQELNNRLDKELGAIMKKELLEDDK